MGAKHFELTVQLERSTVIGAPPTLINHLRHGLHGTGRSNPHCDGMLLIGAARRVKVLALGVAPAAPVVG